MNYRRWRAVACLLLAWATVLPAAVAERLADRQARPWQPSADATELPLWPAARPLPSPPAGKEESYGTATRQIAGRPLTFVEDVSRPTMSIYRPKGPPAGATVVVFPGGGYRLLAIDLEGTEICDWLTARGITCVLLKYRVPGSGPYWSDACNCRRIPDQPYALQDAQRAIGLLRARATALGIDPHRIGVLGFSAGGHLVAEISNRARRSYRPVDDADRYSSRPDFAMAIYPGHLWQAPRLALNPTVGVAADCPPTLLVHAGDDPVDDVRHSMVYYLALQQAGIPVEMHVYPQGGHAFGVRPTAAAITQWPAVAEKWLRSIGMLAAQDD